MPISISLSREELLPWFGWPNAQCTVYEGGPGGPPTSVIRTNQPWGIHFEWETAGALNFLMSGTWHLTAQLEKMGVEEFDLLAAAPGVDPKNVPFVSEPHTYSEWLVFPANIVSAGVYRLIVTITMDGPGGVPGPIAGYGDGGLLQFYKTPIP